MASRSILLALFLTSLIAFAAATAAAGGGDGDLDADEDLSFLDEGDDESPSDFGDEDDEYTDDGSYSDLDDFDPSGNAYDDEDELAGPAVDEKDVVVLSGSNFTDFLAANRHVLVEFYAPWCGHCKALAPEYAAAATELKGEGVVLAKVDATEEDELSEKFDVQGFPTVLFFVDGAHKLYPGSRSKDGIVTWIKKRIGPALHNVTTTKEAEKILATDSKIVLGFFDSLVGADSLELSAVSQLEDDVSFYQTVNPDVLKVFHIDPKAKRPSLVMIKREEEKLAYFDGEFTKSAIEEFVFANKLPLVTTFTRESATLIFENPIKKQLLLFATSKDSEKVLPVFQEAAKSFKGKLIFVYVELDNEDVGKPVSEYFGITGDVPKVLAYTGNEDAKKFVLDGEVTFGSIKNFAEGFLEDKLKPFLKSEPIPETNDGDVKIVVGDNFDEIVLDESKDVLLELYAPWCGHCQSLEPTYNKLAKHLRGIESLVIAKMDGTTNEHPRAKSDGFPTLLFFPAGNKNFDPITVDTDRTVVAFYKFIKKHASIPFKLQKPTAAAAAPESSEPTAAATRESEKSTGSNVKDEL